MRPTIRALTKITGLVVCLLLCACSLSTQDAVILGLDGIENAAADAAPLASPAAVPVLEAIAAAIPACITEYESTDPLALKIATITTDLSPAVVAATSLSAKDKAIVQATINLTTTMLTDLATLQGAPGVARAAVPRAAPAAWVGISIPDKWQGYLAVRTTPLSDKELTLLQEIAVKNGKLKAALVQKR